MLLCAYSSHLPPQSYPNWSYNGLFFPIIALANVCFAILWLFFSKKHALISTAGILLCLWAVRAYWPVNMPQSTPENSLKLMSYNVMMFGSPTSEGWKDNPIAMHIKNSGADIVCLQEVGALYWGVKLGKEHFSDYPYIKINSGKSSGVACLSKYPILSDHRIEYESAGNSSFAYEILIGEDTLLVINNHFESYKLSDSDKTQYKGMIKNIDNEETSGAYSSLTSKLIKANKRRGPQVDSVAQYIESAKDKYKYIIACGDFNDTPISYTHHRLTDHLNDAYTRSGNGPGFTYHRHGMLFRLDHILTNDNVKPLSTFVDKSIETSDHYPILCDFSLK